MAGIIEVKDQGKLRIYDADNSHYVDIVVPSSVTANRTITIPDASFTVPQADTNTVYTHPNHSGEVTSSADGATVIADNIVDEANLKVSNSAVNGYMLTAQSGNTGGLTWAAAPSGGLSMVDQWRLISTLTVSGDGTTDITANLERIDTATPGFIGSAMTQSSGLFSFPSTGIYEITSIGNINSGGSLDYVRLNHMITPDNGSNYYNQTEFNGHNHAGVAYSTTAISLFDVTNISTHKIKFQFRHPEDATLQGNTNVTMTTFFFKKLGDT